MGIRPSIVLTYQSVTERGQQLFRRLALLEVPVFSGWLSAALLDESLDAAEDVLDDLIGAQLVESAEGGPGGHNQYRFHDLIRVFARERLVAAGPGPAGRAAPARALGALLYLAEEAHRRYFGGAYVQLRCDALRWPLPARLVEQLVGDPLSWYERERVALVAGVRQAAHAGLVDLSWGLASGAVPLFESRVYLDDWQETHEIALAATRKARHLRGLAAMLRSIGSFHLSQQRIEPARAELTEAARLFQQVGDERGIALVDRDLAYLDRLNGRLDEATRRYEQAVAVFRRVGDQITTAYSLHSLAQIRLELNQPDDAKELLAEALLLCRAAQCGRIEAQVLHRLGEAHVLAGELADALQAFESSLTISSEIGDLVGQSYSLQGTGVVRVRQAKFNDARKALNSALDLATGSGERLAEAQALFGLGELALADGDPEQAVVFGRQASDLFRAIGAVLHDARALTLLGHAHAALGDVAAADAASAEAVALRAKVLGDGSLTPVSLDGPGAGAVTAVGVRRALAGPPSRLVARQAPGEGSHPVRAATRA
jgi:tetratricopeptide (TPR) repeat protein